MSKTLEDLLSNPHFFDDYATLRVLLERSGLLEYLRVAGLDYLSRPYKDMGESALNAARTAGWQDCLTQIDKFKEALNAMHNASDNTLRADFGSLQSLVENNILTPEEKEAIANGTNPDYSKHYTKPVATSTASAK